MTDYSGMKFHFFHRSNTCFIGVSKVIYNLDFFLYLFEIAQADFPCLKYEDIKICRFMESFPFASGISFNTDGIQDKYIEILQPLKYVF